GMTAVGRVDKVQLTNVDKTTPNGKTQITYKATLPIVWGDKDNIPETITLKLPLDISSSAQDAFATKYKGNCVDFGAHDVDSGSMFYYFRPLKSGCNVADADVVTVKAKLSP